MFRLALIGCSNVNHKCFSQLPRPPECHSSGDGLTDCWETIHSTNTRKQTDCLPRCNVISTRLSLTVALPAPSQLCSATLAWLACPVSLFSRARCQISALCPCSGHSWCPPELSSSWPRVLSPHCHWKHWTCSSALSSITVLCLT